VAIWSLGLTNLDVLSAVHTTLMTCVKQEEWHSLGEGSPEQGRVNEAYWKRWAVGRTVFGDWIGWALKRI
jgi:hypothetical protein